MDGRKLREARQRAGISVEELAHALEVAPGDVAAWEGGARLPARVARSLPLILYHLEAEKVAERAGIPACAWLESQPGPPASADLGQLERESRLILAHVKACPTCLAREQAIETVLGPPPNPLPWYMGILTPQLGPRWLNSAWTGAIVVASFGALGIVVLLLLAIVERDVTRLLAALGLAIVCVLAGAAGGLAHHLTVSLRRSGTVGHYVSWALVVQVYLAAAIALLALGNRMAILGAGNIPVLDLDAGLIVGFVVVAGSLIGYVIARSQAEPLEELEEPKSAWKTWGPAALLMVFTIVSVVLKAPGAVRQARRTETPTLSEAQEQVRRKPGDAWAHLSFGSALDRARRTTEAAAEYREALRIDPGLEEAKWRLAYVTSWRGSCDEAVQVWATVRNPETVWGPAQRSVGYCFVELNRTDEALALARISHRQDTMNVAARELIVLALREGRRYEEALTEARMLSRVAPGEPRSWLTLARAAFYIGNLDEARAAYDSVLKVAPDLVRRSASDSGMYAASGGRAP